MKLSEACLSQVNKGILDAIFRRAFERLHTADMSYMFTRYLYEQVKQGTPVPKDHPIRRVIFPTLYNGFLVDTQISAGSGNITMMREVDREIKTNFRSIGQQFIVSAWATLESLLDDFCVFWLMHFPDLFRGLKLNKGISIEIEVLLFPASHKYEIAQKLVDHIKGAYPNMTSMVRFEKFMQQAGFTDFSLTKNVTTGLTELENARHITVHNDGRIDSIFKKRCPDPKANPENINDFYQITLDRRQNFFDQIIELTRTITAQVRSSCPKIVNGPWEGP